jgi:hypothetical protein
LATSAGAATGATALAGSGGRLRAWGQWLRSWLRPTVALYLPADQPEQSFAAWCRAHPGTPVRLLLAGGLTHQCVAAAHATPAGPEHGNALGSLRRLTGMGGQGDAAARAQAAQDWALHYGDASHTWPITAWQIRSGSGAGQYACVALHGASLVALRRSAQAYGVRLQSAAPLWAALLPWADAKQPQWCGAGRAVQHRSGTAKGAGSAPANTSTNTSINTSTETITDASDDASDDAALAVVEGALLTWVQCGPAGVRAVLQRRLPAPRMEALAQKMHSLRSPKQRVLVLGFGLDASDVPQAQPEAAQAWHILSPLEAHTLPGPVLAALAGAPGRRVARRWPQADLLHRPGQLGLLGGCLVLAAWLGLAGSAVLWQHSHTAYTQAQQQRNAAAASLQSARAAQRGTPQAPRTGAGTGTSTAGTARTALPVDTQTTVRLQARKVMAGLRHAWAGVLLPIEATASDQVRWLELDCSTEGGPDGKPGSGRVRLLGHANTSAAALRVVQALSEQSGWSQVALTKLQASTPRDPAGGVRFELAALYRSPPPARVAAPAAP